MCVCVCILILSKRIHIAVCGPIWTKFGTHMQIHLEREVGEKNSPCDLGALGGFKGSEIDKCGKAAKPLDRSAPNFSHIMQIHLGMNLG